MTGEWPSTQEFQVPMRKISNLALFAVVSALLLAGFFYLSLTGWS
jgi:hypothetical protein